MNSDICDHGIKWQSPYCPGSNRSKWIVILFANTVYCEVYGSHGSWITICQKKGVQNHQRSKKFNKVPIHYYTMRFVASRSLLAICDHKISNPQSESRSIPTTFPTKAGESIYIHPTALTNFINNYLPKLIFPFVLVSGDSDTTVPTDVQNQANIILNHPLLLEWYAQNCIGPSGKLKQLPIGLDFHTLAASNHSWGPQQSLDSQENDIDRLKSIHLIKQISCYCNFHFLLNTRYAVDRRAAIAYVPRSLTYYESHKVPRIESWKTMIQHKFVLSPHGNGLDCHRTWEALALGCIPIMRSSPLNPMFEGLPVLIVKEWRDVTPELLNNFQPSGSLEKLQLSYWYKLIHQYK